MQPDPKNTALKMFLVVGRTDPWTKNPFLKAATTGGFDFQFYKGKSLHTQGQKQKIHPDSKSYLQSGCTNHMGFFQT